MRAFLKKLELDIFLEKVKDSPPLLFVPQENCLAQLKIK